MWTLNATAWAIGNKWKTFFDWTNTPIGYAASVLAILTAIVALARWIKHRKNPPIVDPIQKHHHDVEDHYLLELHDSLLKYAWDPKSFVNPTLHAKEGSAKVRPVLLALDIAAASRASSDGSEKVVSRPVRDLVIEAKVARDLTILGDPGAGKTVCLLELGRRLAKESLDSNAPNRVIPVFVPLSQYSENEQSGEPLKIRDLLVAAIHRIVPDAQGDELIDRIDILLRDKRLAVMFDAVDEMPRADYYDRWRKLRAFAELNRGNIFVFSCRLLDAIEDTSGRSQTVMVSSFSEKQVQSYLRRNGVKSEKVRTLIQRDPDLRRQLSSPFFLSLLTATLRARGDIPVPATWDVLIKYYVDSALDDERRRREAAVTSPTWVALVRGLNDFLSRLAYDLVKVKSSGTVADPATIDQALKDTGASKDACDLAKAAGLLRQVSEHGDLRFTHHKLQEFFAARMLADELNEGSLDIRSFVDDIWWQEVVVMAAGLMQDPDALIAPIIELNDSDVPDNRFRRQGFNRTLVAVRMLQTTRSKLSVGTQQLLTDRLRSFLSEGDLLQRVRALRIAHLVASSELVDAVKASLGDQSRWVRENAMFALSNMVSATPQFLRLVWREVLEHGRHADIFEVGLAEFWSTLTQQRDLRVAGVLLGGFVHSMTRTLFAAILYASPFFLAWRYGPLPGAFLAIYSGLAVVLYLFGRWYNRLGFFAFLGVVVNRPLRVFLPPFILTASFCGCYYGYLVTRHYLAGILQVIAAALVFLLFAVIVRAIFRPRDRTLQDKVAELREKVIVEAEAVFDAHVYETSKGMSQDERDTRATRLIEMAKSYAFRPQRMETLRRLLFLYPLSERVLTALEEFARIEPDVAVRETAWQMYDQIDLGLQRGVIREDAKAPAVELLEHDLTWSESFEQEKGLLKSVFKEGTSFEHFGATSIPGLHARPIVDVLVLVDEEPSEDVLKAFHPQGYVASQAKPVGVLWLLQRRGPRPFDLHVAHAQSRFAKNGTLWRDFLRGNDDEVADFSAAKMRFASGEEKVSYEQAKALWIESGLERASEWYVLQRPNPPHAIKVLTGGRLQRGASPLGDTPGSVPRPSRPRPTDPE